MMGNPQFLQQMSTMMSNPAIMDQVIAMNPQLQAVAPQVRAAFQSPQFREMVYALPPPPVMFPFPDHLFTPHRYDPQRLQQMFQMASMFNSFGSGPGAGNPFGGMGAGGGFPAPGIPNANVNPTSPPTTTPNTTNPAAPFNMFAPPAAGAGTGAGGANPFGMDPAAMQQMLGMMGGGGTPAPADTRPPEERFQVQLQVCYAFSRFSRCSGAWFP